jgi:ribonucleoside-diphosphate reductase alpha chain
MGLCLKGTRMFKQDICFNIWGAEKGGKYRLRDKDGNEVDKTPEDTCDRVSKTLANVELTNKDHWFKEFRAIVGTKFSGGGRIMANAGAQEHKKETSLINCVVSKQIGDSMRSIMNAATEAALILKSGCGIGYDFSPIRPRGALVYGAGAGTSGVVSFMKIFDAICSTVESGGNRRGSQMGCLDVQHPDIEEFVKSKQVAGVLRYFNLSCLVTKEFMAAVEKDSNWDLWFWEKYSKKVSKDKICIIKAQDIPFNHPEFDYFCYDSNHQEVLDGNCTTETIFKKRIHKTIKAKELFDLIIKLNFDFGGEPGFICIDRVNEENNLWMVEKIRASNPCQPGWATVLTKSGITTLEKILIGDIIWSGTQWTKVINKVCTGIKPVYAFKTRAGTFYGTENHRVISNSEKVEVKDAESIDIALGPNDSLKKQDLTAIMDGLVIGDGTTHKATSSTKAFLIIGENDQDYFNSEIKNLILEHRNGIKKGYYDVATTITSLPKTYERSVPEKYKFSDFSTKCNFLRGLYSANGSIVSNRITLKTASFKIIEDVQQMLSSIGIPSYYTINKPHEVEFNNGIYDCKQSYDLNIGTLIGRKLFNNLIGFIQSYKTEKLSKTLETNQGSKQPKTTFEIVEKEFISEEIVYDITVEAEEHSYWTCGLLVSNCGEQFLGPGAVCLLGSMILPAYIKNPFTPTCSFDFDSLVQDIKTANRFLDNVVEINNLPLPFLDKTLQFQRRHGLGVTGIGSALNMLCMKYGSKESIEFAEKISLLMAQESLKENIIIAKEKGSAPFCKEIENRKHFMQSGYMKRLLNSFDETVKQKIIEDILEFGVRWSHATSIAPTGTMSLTWGNNCSNGIEPVYLNSLMRNIRVPGKKTKTQVEVMDYSFFEWKRHFKDAPLPSWWSTTETLTVEDHLSIQEVMQRWTDAAISKTINVPATYSFEEFKNVYVDAYKRGLKGITTFRYNPETTSGVLVSKENLKATKYKFILEDKTEVIVSGDETIEYDGETHNAANLFDALKEGLYGNI